MARVRDAAATCAACGKPASCRISARPRRTSMRAWPAASPATSCRAKGRVPNEWISGRDWKSSTAPKAISMRCNRVSRTCAPGPTPPAAPIGCDDAESWRERTRAVEDKLSDALHEALTQRFIDRRTIGAAQGLEARRRAARRHFRGWRGDGRGPLCRPARRPRVQARPARDRRHRRPRRAQRGAGGRCSRKLSRRLARIAAAQEMPRSRLAATAALRVDGAAVARLAPGAPVLKPRLS